MSARPPAGPAADARVKTIRKAHARSMEALAADVHPYSGSAITAWEEEMDAVLDSLAADLTEARKNAWHWHSELEEARNRHAETLAESEAYAKEGWDWLSEALDALGASDVFEIKGAKARHAQTVEELEHFRFQVTQDVGWAAGVLRTASDVDDQGSVAARALTYLDRLAALAADTDSQQAGQA